MLRFKHLFGSILLISGTTIGGGMLALPILTAQGGFLPSIVIYLAAWLFMASTGLLLLEMCLWHETETNIVTLAHKTLGKVGLIGTWLVYLFFFYCLTIAYVVGTQGFVNYFLGTDVSGWISSIIFIIIFAPIIYLGARAVEGVNNIFMVGLIVSYFVFVYMGFPHVEMARLKEMNLKYSMIAFPVIFVSFGYQGIVPSITFYLRKNVKAIRLAIIIGSFIPLITYVFWEGLILGMVPASFLKTALIKGQNAIIPFQEVMGRQKITFIGQAFGFFALATTLLGVTLGLRDFLADGLKIKKNTLGKLFLVSIIFIPPVILGSYKPGIFLKALNLGGGIGSTLLLGLLPIMMVWSKRYVKKFKNNGYQVWGGKPFLILLALFCLLGITFVGLYSFGALNKILN